MLSKHLGEGLLEGYLLSGRHGLFTCYEAFVHIIDSMFNSDGEPGRRPHQGFRGAVPRPC